MDTLVDIAGVLGFLLALVALGIEFRGASADKRTELIRALIDARNQVTALKKQVASQHLLAEQAVKMYPAFAALATKSATTVSEATELEVDVTALLNAIGKYTPVAHPADVLERMRGSLIKLTDDTRRMAEVSQSIATDLHEVISEAKLEAHAG